MPRAGQRRRALPKLDAPQNGQLHKASKRAAKVAETRSRILAALRRMLLTDGIDRVNISSLIKHAGVARSTVHYQFHSREGLMEEVFREALTAAEVDWMHPARDVADPGEAVETMVVQACRAWAADQMLFRRFMALAVIDEDARRAAYVLDQDRQRGIDELVRRLTDAQQPALEATPKRARTILSLATSFWTFDRVLEETMSKVEAATILVDLARSLLAPAGWKPAA